MPRQSRSRPSARPASSSSSFSSSGQTRSASTAAYPGTAPPTTHAPSQAHARPQEKQPGMLAQMAATAGSVAVGSTIGHGLSSMLFGGRSEAPPPAEYQQPVQQQQYQPQNSGLSCDFQAKEFTKCMETGDINTCGWYLEQLKAVCFDFIFARWIVANGWSRSTVPEGCQSLLDDHRAPVVDWSKSRPEMPVDVVL
ncbi:hypothetical protein FRC08_016238 [Ceratobasidium sp. 394]|nr:hypothetical protein FRC08_016238 [Ceratobasidium sp. 394]